MSLSWMVTTNRLRNILGANPFFYFDPPYKPVNESNACTSYMSQDFRDEEQVSLADFCKEIGEAGGK